MTSRGPRVLVTGFEPFPGAPVNPTEALVRRLQAEPLQRDGAETFRAELLPVDYASIGPRLSKIGRVFSPDIALHFGLALEAKGFRLERIARNSFERARPDNRGATPPAGPICGAPPTLAPTLPLAEIHEVLNAERLPAEWSDDAGAYLCNMTMTLSLAAACDGFAPTMSGFIHVPLVGERSRLTETQFMRGVDLMLGVCLRCWTVR